MKEIYKNIVSVYEDKCGKLINQEYLEVSKKMVSALARKRPSPLMSGDPELWAASILYCVARINFLFDKDQENSISTTDYFNLFSIPKAKISRKSTEITKTLKLFPMMPNYCIPSLIDENPIIWTISINGFLVDIREMSREVQEEAFRQGVIPYVYADRKKE